MDLRDLYQEIILGHNKRPKNKGVLDPYDGKGEGFNPLCGDEVNVAVRVEGDRIAEVKFTGKGCAISQASASVMTGLVSGKSPSEVEALFTRFHDLVIEQKAQQNDLDPRDSGRCLAEAQRSGAFNLPLMDDRVKQFMARVDLIHATMPELEFVPFDEPAIIACLARAFNGLTLVKEAQAAPLIPAFQRHLEKGQIEWLNELLPASIPWLDKGKTKVSYQNGTPEAQVKLQECWALEEHPTLCEGRLPVLLNLSPPKGKVIATTNDWPHFLAREWPKHRPTVAKKFPGHVWR